MSNGSDFYRHVKVYLYFFCGAENKHPDADLSLVSVNVELVGVVGIVYGNAFQ